MEHKMNILKFKNKPNDPYKDLFDDMHAAWIKDEDSQQKLKDYFRRMREVEIKYHGNIFQKLILKCRQKLRSYGCKG
jgi:hypothetical protein